MTMENGCTISLVSMQSRCGRIEENLADIEAWIRRARDEGASIVVFPEAALTGYCLAHAPRTALAIDDPAVRAVDQVASDAGVTVFLGLVERVADKLFVTQVALGSAVATPWVYRKTHLGMRESAVFTPGDALPTFPTQAGERCDESDDAITSASRQVGSTTAPLLRVGVGICYDMHFPEVASTLRAHGADVIVSPHASPVKAGSREQVWAKYMPTRAYDNRLYAACCNACGDNDCGTQFSGGLAVYAPNGSLLAADFTDTPTMLTTPLPTAAFSGGKDFPAHRHPELYL